MNLILLIAAALLLSYLAGSIPFGWIIVKIATGKDVTRVESGRTGGTNAMRAAGLVAGLLTGFFDVMKGVSTAWIVSWLAPGLPWVRVAAALIAVMGHNHSIFLIDRDPVSHHIRLRGGAGGATVLGGAIALWPSTWYIVLPLSAAVFLFGGYASLTTISVAFFSIVIFGYRAWIHQSPWEYAMYGVISLGVVMWALRPNIKRLKEGTERRVRGLWVFFLKKTKHPKKVTTN
jgi:glycerol-3-phosphate acyltransferase PlsY